jgi:MoaA/NifB/PqqE/SkfB family radical SAM enzyme
MKIYTLLRIATLVRSERIKLFGIWILHVLGKRYTGIFLDPVFACNLRCKMCYFSDEEKRKNYHGIFRFEDIEQIAKALFERALKLQIGCGAEPTLHKDLIKIIALGRQYKIPYISLTTNGNLLTKELISDAAKAGLNEIILSAHGLTKRTYEHWMRNGRVDLFRQTLQYIRDVKTLYPKLKLRINYTINNDNLEELSRIWEIIGDEVDILQMRPVQKIGNSEYTDFDMTKIYDRYDVFIAPVADECRRRKILCLFPAKKDLLALKSNTTADKRFETATYCYVSPLGCWREDFNYKTDTFKSYSQTHHLGKKILGSVFGKKQKQDVDVTHKLNYSIK